MSTLSNLVKEYFESNDWEYDLDSEDEGVFMAGVATENGEFDIVVQSDDSLNHISCYCIHPEPVPEERRDAMVEFMMRVNSSNILAIYDMDYDTGTVRVRSSITIADVKPTPHLIETLIDGAVTTSDVYYPGLLAVLEDELSPQEALDECIALVGQKLMGTEEKEEE